METVLIKHEIEKERYNNMSDDTISSIVRAYSGRLVDIEDKGDVVVLHIIAPSTWSTCLLYNILLPYRYI